MKNKLLFTFVITVLFITGLLFLPFQAWTGGPWYVTQSGAGAKNGTSLANAWDVSQFNALTGIGYAGDTFYLSGTFTSQVIPDISGISGNRVVLDGYEGGTYDATDGNRTNLASLAKLTHNDSDGAMWVAGCDYLTIQDFNFDGGESDENGMNLEDASGNEALWVTVQNCYFHEYTNVGFLTSSQSAQPSVMYLTLQNNEFYDISTSTAGHSVRLNRTEQVLIQYNKVWTDDTARDYGTGGITWGFGVDELLIQYNFVAYQNRNVPQPWGEGNGEGGFGGKDGQDIIIRYNKAYYNCDDAAGAGVGCSYNGDRRYMYCNWLEGNWDGGRSTTGDVARASDGDDCTYAYYFSNIIIHSINNGINLAPYTGSDTLHHVWIFNNTFYGNARDPEWSSSSGVRAVSSRIEDVVIKNNIFEDNRPDESNYIQVGIVGGTTDETTITHNRFYHPDGTAKVYWDDSVVTASTVGSDNTVGASGLTDPANDDFTVAGGAAVIDAGTDMGSGAINSIVIMGGSYSVYWDIALAAGTDFSGTDPTTWVVNTVRRDDVGWDQGAYAFASGLEVTVTATDPTATEENTTTGTWTIACSPNCDGETINYAFSGTAILDTDYDCDDEDGTITITGANDTIVLTPVDDDVQDVGEFARITINSGEGYSVGSPSTADINIEDNDGAQEAGVAGITVDASGSGQIMYDSSGSGSWTR